MNKVTLQGKIKSIANYYDISVVTLQTKSGKTEEVNYPQITFTKNERSMLFDFEVGDYVRIIGTVKTRGDKDKKYVQFVRGLWIGKIKNKMSELFDEDISGWYEYQNQVLIKGDVVSTTRLGRNVCSMLIKPEDENFYVSVVQYSTTPNFLAEKYKGRKVYAYGELQTKQKEAKDGGRPVTYHNIVLSYVAVQPRSNNTVFRARDKKKVAKEAQTKTDIRAEIQRNKAEEEGVTEDTTNFILIDTPESTETGTMLKED